NNNYDDLYTKGVVEKKYNNIVANFNKSFFQITKMRKQCIFMQFMFTMKIRRDFLLQSLWEVNK
ncbi:hypothetical protein, partial [Candidatus Kuenenia stuttgartiensis]|uniref:hypothetical protein n=1 Tax=Kuenenia stuttgartiensis TaxID=174633 RepID=UPI001B8AFCAA